MPQLYEKKEGDDVGTPTPCGIFVMDYSRPVYYAAQQPRMIILIIIIPSFSVVVFSSHLYDLLDGLGHVAVLEDARVHDLPPLATHRRRAGELGRCRDRAHSQVHMSSTVPLFITQVYPMAKVCLPDFLSAASSILDSTENTSSFDTGNRGLAIEAHQQTR
jgi:hypothetical protein